MDFLTNLLTPAEWKLHEDLLDKEVLFIEVIPCWRLFFDGIAQIHGDGMRVVFATPHDLVMTEKCSNNMDGY